ncbi:hypothetical protein AWC38_SpisGene20226 [Stylophora pistillata]|uniref:DUF4781 domain-containing protein n=1 Tax=Stylophora pistillata TaxID=50429 RepID=A0A2B4REI1_STYPI|nr:hypothetical protein AWC38_SpisGene20226 [Stylophora pistillata]
MGNSSSESFNGDALRQELEQVPQLPLPSLNLAALAAFEEFEKSLENMELFKSKFTFRREDVKCLTEDEFGKMMDRYQIPETQRYGSKASSVVVHYEESGSFVKTILMFSRSKKHRYDVVVAEKKMSTNLDWERTGLVTGYSAAVTGVASVINPALGMSLGILSLLRIGSKVIKGPNQHESEDIITGFMMKQLIAAQDLVATEQGKLAFVHGGHHILLDEAESPRSSCCTGCSPFKRKKCEQ